MFRLYANAIRFGAAVALLLSAAAALSPVRTGAAEPGQDAAGVRDALRKLMPGTVFNVDPVGDSVVITGAVANAADAAKVAEAAIRLVGDEKKVVNGLTIKGKEQVLLKVTVAEVQRN